MDMLAKERETYVFVEALNGKTFVELGRELGISAVRIRQIFQRARQRAWKFMAISDRTALSGVYELAAMRKNKEPWLMVFGSQRQLTEHDFKKRAAPKSNRAWSKRSPPPMAKEELEAKIAELVRAFERDSGQLVQSAEVMRRSVPWNVGGGRQVIGEVLVVAVEVERRGVNAMAV
jgi:hypothetical protein